MYRFAYLGDIFGRSRYFGRSLDLGQFERFRRVLRAPEYSTLLRHEQTELLSALQACCWALIECLEDAWTKGALQHTPNKLRQTSCRPLPMSETVCSIGNRQHSTLPHDDDDDDHAFMLWLYGYLPYL
jgi:hypothetical protein